MTTSTVEEPPTYARIVSLDVPRHFVSSRDNQFSAVITFANDSDLVHSAQVVFRGYIRVPYPKNYDAKAIDAEKRDVKDLQEHNKKIVPQKAPEEKKPAKKEKQKGTKTSDKDKSIYYEFLHEQVWVIIDRTGTVSHEAFLDVWLPRFPPSGPLYKDGPVVEYACRVTVDPWYDNHFVEKKFDVIRQLVLKQPHIAAYPNHIKVNRCVDHGGMGHKTCKPVNGELWTEKGAFVPGEKFVFRWKLKQADGISDAKVSLIRTITWRQATPGNPQMLTTKVDTIATMSLAEQRERDKKEGKKSTDDNVSMIIPESVWVTIPMCIFNVMSCKYEVLLQVKVGKSGKYTDFKLPLIVCSEYLEARPNKVKPADKDRYYSRAIDVDDDSQDDDDTDSEIEDSPDKVAEEKKDFSIEIENLMVSTKANGQLQDAYAEVFVLINSHVPRALHGLRLMFVGEVRAGAVWYEFLRYKAIVFTNEETALSPGEHVVKVALPFADTQYDTNILAPSLDDDIRYLCKVTMKPWSKNNVQAEREVFVDRFVDTWAKREFYNAFEDEVGAWTVKMRQRNFQRGKWVFAKIDGDFKTMTMQLVQRRRLRIPGLLIEESYVHERIIQQINSPEDRTLWPTEWAIEIPDYIQPSLEISYWNVLVLSYTLIVIPKGADGHAHTHNVPIWIGCTDDNLGPPEKIIPPAAPAQSEIVRVPSQASLPEFEVWDQDEWHEQPWWVERFNRDTYTFTPREPKAPPAHKPTKKEKEKAKAEEPKPPDQGRPLTPKSAYDEPYHRPTGLNSLMS